MVTKEEAKQAVKTLLGYLENDAEREGLLKTPQRVIDSWDEILRNFSNRHSTAKDMTELFCSEILNFIRHANTISNPLADVRILRISLWTELSALANLHESLMHMRTGYKIKNVLPKVSQMTSSSTCNPLVLQLSSKHLTGACGAEVCENKTPS